MFQFLQIYDLIASLEQIHYFIFVSPAQNAKHTDYNLATD